MMAKPMVILHGCVHCCLTCCHRFVKYINENTYCQIALTGENFCTAAMNGFLLILKHTATFAFTKGMSGIFNVLGKLTVSLLVTAACYIIIIYWADLYTRINSPIGPMIVVFFVSYAIAYLFMAIYSTTALCILHCLYADIDICKTLSKDEMKNIDRPKEMKSVVKLLSGTGNLKPLIS